jgi:hypothetical protein
MFPYPSAFLSRKLDSGPIADASDEALCGGERRFGGCGIGSEDEHIISSGFEA